MSKFFILSNTVSDSTIDDSTISTDSTYSSYYINQLLNDLASKVLGCNFVEYPADIRASPQKQFETPDYNDGDIMWILREGVKMVKDIDYIVIDSTHIEFIESVAEKYTISILVFSKNGGILAQMQGHVSSSTTPLIFVQSTPTLLWKVNHESGFQYPRIEIIDNQDDLITDCVQIHYDDVDNLTVTSEIPFQGKCIIYY